MSKFCKGWFTALIGALGLGLLALLLLRLIQPTQLIFTIRADANLRLRLLYERGEPYIAFYSSKPIAAQLTRSSQFSALAFSLVNDQARSLKLMLGNQPARFELGSLRIKTFLSEREWPAQEIARAFIPRGPVTEFAVQTDRLVVVSNGRKAALETGPAIAKDIRALRQQDDLILLTFGGLIVALVLLGVVRHLYARPRSRGAPWTDQPRLRAWLNPSMLLIGLCLGYGLLRVFNIALHTPLIGYANSGDFYRLQACFGLRANTPFGFLDRRRNQAPVGEYEWVGAPIRQRCYLSTQALVLLPAFAVNRLLVNPAAPQLFQLKTLGVVSAALLSLAALILTTLYTRLSKGLGLISALTFALVLSDPFITLFLNTLFSEFSMLLLAYTSVGLAFYVMLARHWSPELLVALAASLFLLGVSKVQNLGLPLVIALWLGGVGLMQWPDRARRRQIAFGLSALLIAAGLTVAIQLHHQQQGGYQRVAHKANAMNAYLATLAPRMSQPLEGLRAIGLEQCAPLLGRSWFDAPAKPARCLRQLERVSYLASIQLLIRDPTLIVKLWAPAIAQTQAWTIDYVGQIEGDTFQTLDLRFPAPTWSLAWLFQGMPSAVYEGLVWGLMIGMVVALGILAAAQVRPLALSHIQLALVQLLMGAVFTYSMGTALFGDGLGELAKHTFLARPALLLGSAAGLAQLTFLAQAGLRRITAADSTTPATKALR